MKINKNQIYLIIIICIGFFFRLLWIIIIKTKPISDFNEYLKLAENILIYKQFGYPEPTAYRLPVYPIYLALNMLINDSVLLLCIGNAVISSLTIILIYIIAIQLCKNSKIALISAAFYAFNPAMIYFSSVLASEHIFVFLLLIVLLLLNKNSKLNLLKIISAGLIFGLSILTRAEAVFYLPVFIFLIFINFKNKFITKIILFLIFTIIIVSPLIIRNYLVFDKIVLSTSGGINFYFAHNDEKYGWYNLKKSEFSNLNEFELNRKGYKIGIKNILDKPYRIFFDSVKGTIRQYLYKPTNYAVYWSIRKTYHQKPISFTVKLILLIISTIYYFALLISSFLSFFFIKKNNLKLYQILIGMILMNWICYCFIFWGKPRYRFFPDILINILAAVFIYKIIQIIKLQLYKRSRLERIK